MKCVDCKEKEADNQITGLCHVCLEKRFPLNPYKAKAGGIESYFTSPLALREQYGTEMKINMSERMEWYREDGLAIELLDYIENLESKLCNVKGS